MRGARTNSHTRGQVASFSTYSRVKTTMTAISMSANTAVLSSSVNCSMVSMQNVVEEMRMHTRITTEMSHARRPELGSLKHS